MKQGWWALVMTGVLWSGAARVLAGSPVTMEIVGTDGRVFREFPVTAGDGALRSYLLAEKGARYEVRVRNHTGERLGLVIAVDGRNIINGRKSGLSRHEPMYVLDAWSTQGYAGWRADLEAVNEFYFTDWADSYAEAFGDRSARGVIALAVYRQAAPAAPPGQPYANRAESVEDAPALPAAPPSPRADRSTARSSRAREESAGTGYGDRRIDRAVHVRFVAQGDADSRHFIKYEWRGTLCRKRILDCGEKNRFWDESTLGFAPPPPRR